MRRGEEGKKAVGGGQKEEESKSREERKYCDAVAAVSQLNCRN